MYYPGLFGKYHISIEAFYVGAEADAEAADYGSFLAEVGSVRADKISWQHADTFDTFYDKLVAQTPESVNSKDRVQMMPSVVFGQQLNI